MARSCGLRIGHKSFELVVLDGSAKKPSVSFCTRGHIPEDAEDPAAAMVEALKAAVKGHKIPTDAVGLAVDAGQAAFRNLTLPFDDKSKIEEVLKFEVESKLPQWNIEDVVVDFHTLSSTGVESHLLVTAMPKDALREVLETATKAGLEPLDADAETTALFNAAAKAGVLTADGAQVLVHVGEASTAIVVADGGALRSMRAVREGAWSMGDGAARDRLVREILRTVSGSPTANRLDAVWVCGAVVPGLAGTDLEGVSVRRLDPFEAEDLPDGAHASEFAAAYGAALARMDAASVPAHLRREELRFSGTLERLELPLAVCALLLAAWLGIQFAVLQKERVPLEYDLGQWVEGNNNYLLGIPKDGIAGRLRRPSAKVERQAKEALEPGVDRLSALQNLEFTLSQELKDLRNQFGTGDIRQPQSAFGGLARVLMVIDGMKGEYKGRVAIRSARSDYVPKRGDLGDHIEVDLDLSFFADDDIEATRHWEALRADVLDRPWCLQFEPRATLVLDGGLGIQVDGAKILVDMAVLTEEVEA